MRRRLRPPLAHLLGFSLAKTGFRHKIDAFFFTCPKAFIAALAFLLGTEVLKELSPFTVSISINLEPIYAIILALIIFGDEEKMSREFYIGSLIILISIGLNTILKQKKINN